MELRVTRYDHPDAVALTAQTQRYYTEIYGGPDHDPLAAASFLPPRGGFLVGYLEGRPVAMGGWLFLVETPRPDDAQVRRMFVDPSVRHGGFGRTLLRALERDARRHGASRMILTTGGPQAAAIGLYRAAGYVDIDRFGFYAEEPGAVCLGKRLDQSDEDLRATS